MTQLLRTMTLGWKLHFKQESRNPFFLYIVIGTPLIYATMAYFLFQGGEQQATLVAAAVGSADVGGQQWEVRLAEVPLEVRDAVVEVVIADGRRVVAHRVHRGDDRRGAGIAGRARGDEGDRVALGDVARVD